MLLVLWSASQEAASVYQLADRTQLKSAWPEDVRQKKGKQRRSQGKGFLLTVGLQGAISLCFLNRNGGSRGNEGCHGDERRCVMH